MVEEDIGRRARHLQPHMHHEEEEGEGVKAPAYTHAKARKRTTAAPRGGIAVDEELKTALRRQEEEQGAKEKACDKARTTRTKSVTHHDKGGVAWGSTSKGQGRTASSHTWKSVCPVAMPDTPVL